ncbi:MAG TPA: hypothetical protein VJM81_00075 [Rhizorhapis sp.]|nr:hypothetical protein [Rhizorhapis sp.]
MISINDGCSKLLKTPGLGKSAGKSYVQDKIQGLRNNHGLRRIASGGYHGGKGIASPGQARCGHHRTDWRQDFPGPAREPQRLKNQPGIKTRPSNFSPE